MKSFPTVVSRRRIVQGSAAMAAGLSSPAIARGAPPRALALIGDRYHNSDYIRVSLSKVFEPLGVTVKYTINYDELSADLLKPYDLFVVLRDGMIWPDGYVGPDAYVDYQAKLENADDFPKPLSKRWITEDQGAAVQKFVENGGGFYPIHNTCDISLSSKNFREVMGGAYNGHPPERPFQVRATANAHPITAGMSPFMVTDEQHFPTYDKDPRFLILEAENIDGLSYERNGQKLGTKSHAGWAYDYGKGRVAFTAPGHNVHAMWNQQYLEIQKRSVRWLLKQL